MTDVALTADEFASYFEAVHGHRPYPWQGRLTAQVLANERWPDVIDLPTGTGKTAVLDTAVFTLAARPDLFPRRVVFVIDRRIVVDQVYKRAAAISEHIREASDGVLARVRSALHDICSDTDEPIGVSALRGGIPLDKDWATRPDQPWVMVSTVDQFGSKLLFRGYGVSRGMRPIHAGLAGNDCLVILDEVHLSRPFAATLREVHEEPSAHSFNVELLPRRGGAVEMSATPSIEGGTRFALRHEADLDGPGEPSERLRRLARAPKRAKLVEVAGRAAQVALPKEILRIVRNDLRDSERSIGVIVNRVGTAREVQRVLSAEGVKAHLITGRMRPLDRERRLQEIEGLVDPDSRTPAIERAVVVATQAIEVGADFSFDALITEACPVDSFRQRVGRLDRRGTLATETQSAARCWVLGLKSDLAGKKPDPIYGDAVRATWQEMRARSDGDEIEFTPVGSELAGFPAAASAPVRSAPLLLPAHFEAWAQTSPEPLVQPEVSDFLHGFDPDPPEPEVSIVWRWDLSADALRLVPPRSAEQLSVPLSAAKAWLRGSDETPVADVAIRPADSSLTAATAVATTTWAPVLRYVGGNQVVKPVLTRDIGPGDTLVAHPSAGGLTAGTWDPGSSKIIEDQDGDEGGTGVEASAEMLAVEDLGDEAQWAHRRRRTIRLDERLGRQVREWLGDEAPPMPRPLSDEATDPNGAGDEAPLPKRQARQWIDELLESDATAAPLSLRWLVGDPSAGSYAGVGALRHMREAADFVIELIQGPALEEGDADGARRHDAYYVLVENAVDASALDVDDDPSLTGTGVSLDAHLAGVGARAAHFALQLGLSTELTEDLGLAGRLHDLGKVDCRFQAQLAGHDPVELERLNAPLAKSAPGVRTRPCAWPPVRHEVASVALAQSSPEVLARAHDSDLVLHLVATHHGKGRPLAQIVRDTSPQDLSYELNDVLLRARTDFSDTSLALQMADRFWRLGAKYGHHGLAWLEAILRLADHRQSELENTTEIRSLGEKA